MIMAEVFGTVAGALSVAALFNCVDCFEYIQLGRHFSLISNAANYDSASQRPDWADGARQSR
jgi:hypothetical protein